MTSRLRVTGAVVCAAVAASLFGGMSTPAVAVEIGPDPNDPVNSDTSVMWFHVVPPKLMEPLGGEVFEFKCPPNFPYLHHDYRFKTFDPDAGIYFESSKLSWAHFNTEYGASNFVTGGKGTLHNRNLWNWRTTEGFAGCTADPMKGTYDEALLG